MSKLPLEYLKHIVEETEFLISETKNLSEEDFSLNPILKRAFVRSLEIIGEASKNIPSDFRNKYSNVDWKNIARMRDKLIHHYFGIDYEIVWDVVKNEIPSLHKQILEIMNKEKKAR